MPCFLLNIVPIENIIMDPGYFLYTPTTMKNKYVDEITNLSYLDTVSMGNKAFIAEMISIFLRQTPQFLSQLDDYARNGQWVEFRAVMHKLKPSLQMLGINAATPVIEGIDKTSKFQQDQHLFAQRLQTLKELCEQSFMELEKKKAEIIE